MDHPVKHAVRSCWDEQAEAARTNDDVDDRAGVVCFTIRVDQAGLLSCDLESTSPQVDHVWTAEQGSGKEPCDERQGGKRAHWRDRDQVELAVVDPCSWGDPGVVAVLVGVRDGDDERIEFTET